MKTNDILELDFRKDKNREIIQKVLRQIKPLSKCSDEQEIPVEMIEKCVKVLTVKYAIMIQWITMTPAENANEVLYKLSILNAHDHKWLGNVYGLTFYELIAKTAIKMYAEIRSGGIMLRCESNEIKQARVKRAEGDEE